MACNTIFAKQLACLLATLLSRRRRGCRPPPSGELWRWACRISSGTYDAAYVDWCSLRSIMQEKQTRICFAAVRVKHWVLRHYLWVALTLLLLALAAGLIVNLRDWKGWVALVGVPFSFLLTVQRQKTEELELFRKLFTEFNARYDSLHDELYAIARGSEYMLPSADEEDLLFKYFNLCGEEYLFFIQGYIYPEVWRAWHNGMKTFRKNSRIKKLWDTELDTDSYYGLHFEDQETANECDRPGTPEYPHQGNKRNVPSPPDGTQHSGVSPNVQQGACPGKGNAERLPAPRKKGCLAKN